MALTREERLEALHKAAEERILVLDGAMGTMIQRHKLQEADYRGERFKNWSEDLKGNNDLLCLTKPEIIEDIHEAFFKAGSDIVETNSFNSTAISMADYKMEALAPEIAEESAKLARRVADRMSTDAKPRFVAGSVGPLNRTLSVSPDVNNPGYREVSWDQVVDAFKDQIRALTVGGVDLILIETIFDTLNAKAAIFAAEDVFEELGYRLPIMLSFTVTDMSGRNLSGQMVEAFWHSVRHAKPFSVGLNCGFGADNLRPHALTLADCAEARLCFFPNAGLPNEMGDYDETPEITGGHLKSWAEEGLVNIVGGCCGTTPDHIKAIADGVKDFAPRPLPELNSGEAPAMRLSGLDPLSFVSPGCSNCGTA